MAVVSPLTPMQLRLCWSDMSTSTLYFCGLCDWLPDAGAADSAPMPRAPAAVAATDKNFLLSKAVLILARDRVSASGLRAEAIKNIFAVQWFVSVAQTVLRMRSGGCRHRRRIRNEMGRRAKSTSG
jgi:hypothetical protein